MMGDTISTGVASKSLDVPVGASAMSPKFSSSLNSVAGVVTGE